LDWKQIFDFSDPACEAADAPKLGVHGVNQWPDIPEFKETMLRYFKVDIDISDTAWILIVEIFESGNAKCFSFIDGCYSEKFDP